MKAALIAAPGALPVYADFTEPEPRAGHEIVTVSASALTQLTRARASGAHYSADSVFPAVPGSDGVGRTADGRRVYFFLPEAPFGAMAERSLVGARRCLPVPDSLDDITAAALANPGMSAWAALVLRAKLQPGETVLIHGATGSAGSLAVQLAKHLGAGKVIVTGRNAAVLQALQTLGADVAIPLSMVDLAGENDFERQIAGHFAAGVHVVVDYLWGRSALALIAAISRFAEDARPVRFVQVGSAAGEPEIGLPAAALRSSPIVLMGSGLKSVPLSGLLESVTQVFAAAGPAKLEIATRVLPLAEVAAAWEMTAAKPRIVFSIG